MINSSTRLIPDGFCLLDPLEKLSTLRNMAFCSMSIKDRVCKDITYLFIETNWLGGYVKMRQVWMNIK